MCRGRHRGVGVVDAVAVAVRRLVQCPDTNVSAVGGEHRAVGRHAVLACDAGLLDHDEAVALRRVGRDEVEALKLGVIDRVRRAVVAVGVDEALTVERVAVLAAERDRGVAPVDRVRLLDARDRRQPAERPADPEHGVALPVLVHERELGLGAGDLRAGPLISIWYVAWPEATLKEGWRSFAAEIIARPSSSRLFGPAFSRACPSASVSKLLERHRELVRRPAPRSCSPPATNRQGMLVIAHMDTGGPLPRRRRSCSRSRCPRASALPDPAGSNRYSLANICVTVSELAVSLATIT